MEIILFVEKAKSRELEEKLLKDDLVSRANVLFRDSKPFREEGFYVRILGSEEQCEKARELAKEIAEEIVGEEKEKILKTIKEEDERMLSGFSGIFQ
ncbi:MAG: hypothetical protein QXK95_01250 [Nitrososphaerota archaeon]|nr:hypothetical protein [Candidatus Geocrenenecus dongiae]